MPNNTKQALVDLAVSGGCRNRYCRRGAPEPGTSYCIPCADDADDHDQGKHDRDSQEHSPSCQP
ncbi:hypothetical protein OIE69_44365 (plasmid) [Actinacidiphila glaucinigra]|uniref:hypothetical protein n=1 Tax=Actinacidiphila glaucinigra TaxID=235986 RepID=UPI002DDA046D|nr:hypothetical protein [Actinacidiphila glaucinigra]WSD65940.1 hypothetical protein OIE69_44365 [Actinacidiphila glaucinigra]